MAQGFDAHANGEQARSILLRSSRSGGTTSLGEVRRAIATRPAAARRRPGVSQSPPPHRAVPEDVEAQTEASAAAYRKATIGLTSSILSTDEEDRPKGAAGASALGSSHFGPHRLFAAFQEHFVTVELTVCLQTRDFTSEPAPLHVLLSLPERTTGTYSTLRDATPRNVSRFEERNSLHLRLRSACSPMSPRSFHHLRLRASDIRRQVVSLVVAGQHLPLFVWIGLPRCSVSDHSRRKRFLRSLTRLDHLRRAVFWSTEWQRRSLPTSTAASWEILQHVCDL